MQPGRMIPVRKARLLILYLVFAALMGATHVSLGDEEQPTVGEKRHRLGTVKGTVKYRGQVPLATVADNAGQRRKLLTVDQKREGLLGVVVYLDLARPLPEAGDAKSELDPKPVVMDQVDHTFQPHVLAIRTGQRVKFTNNDAANHNVRANSFEPRNQFNVFTGAGVEYDHRFFADDKQRPVMLSCDLHPWMKAWIFIYPHPYFAVTDKLGNFRIAGIPAGEYTLAFRQPDIAYRQTKQIVVKQEETLEVNLQLGEKDLPRRLISPKPSR